MLHVTLLKESSGSAISSLYINSQTLYETQSIDTSRSGNQALLVVLNGTLGQVTQQVSVDGTNYYNVFDSVGVNYTNLTGTTPNSRLIVIDQMGSNKVVAPWTKFRISGAATVTTVSMWYIHSEE
jgi:hypothetical protein